MEHPDLVANFATAQVAMTVNCILSVYHAIPAIQTLSKKLIHGLTAIARSRPPLMNSRTLAATRTCLLEKERHCPSALQSVRSSQIQKDVMKVQSPSIAPQCVSRGPMAVFETICCFSTKIEDIHRASPRTRSSLAESLLNNISLIILKLQYFAAFFSSSLQNLSISPHTEDFNKPSHYFFASI